MNKKIKFVSVLAAMSCLLLPLSMGNTNLETPIEDNLSGSVWQINETVFFADLLQSGDYYDYVFDFHFFDSNQTRFNSTGIEIYYDEYGNGESKIYYNIFQFDGSSNYSLVYDSFTQPRWRDDAFRTIYIDYVESSSMDVLSEFLDTYAVEIPQRYNFFDSIFELLNDLFFGGQVSIDDKSYQSLILQLLTCLFTIAFIVMPFIVVYWIIKVIGRILNAV